MKYNISEDSGTSITVAPTQIKFKKLIPEAQVPFKKYTPDAGFDLYCTSIVKKNKYIEYHTGLAMEIPVGMVGIIVPRSSITDYDLMLKNSLGIINSGVSEEIILYFSDVKEYSMTQKKEIYSVGDSIGVIFFIEVPNVNLCEVEDFDEIQ